MLLLRFLSTLSLRRATTNKQYYILPRYISIHALLAESDRVVRLNSQCTSHFYPRSPCGERQEALEDRKAYIEFLSTLSLRRATIPASFCIANCAHFYPRSPCGERRICRGSDPAATLFLSTLSLRRATAKVHKTVGHFCAYETNFMEIASSC